MQTIIYKARSRSDLYEMRNLLTQRGIESTIIGDPDMSPAPGTKVYYLVELAVAEEESDRAKQIIGERQAKNDARIRHLIPPVRRGVRIVVAITIVLGMFGLVFAKDLLLSALPFLLVAAVVGLSVYASMKSMVRERRSDKGQCIECGYSLRGNRSGRCPECGTAITRGRR